MHGEPYKVPCSFFVWTRQVGDFSLRKTILKENEDFSFCPRGDTHADFSINGNSGKVKEICEITNPKAENYIKAGKKRKKN